ncbi:MAG: signal peptidase I [Coriobacteriia bacterium]|nr:signal peptidase I [Coriobacteriia bacterium]
MAQDKPQGSAGPSVLRDLASLGLKILVVVLVFVLVFTFFYGLDRNTDPDMAPMVKDGDLVMFYRLDKTYAVDDLTVVRYHGKQEVRRVVAGAGDAVDITDEGLVVNGALQQEPNIYQKTVRYAKGVSFPLTVGPGQVFVLGDARGNATDSRVYGPVNTKDTLGTVITLIRRRNF